MEGGGTSQATQGEETAATPTSKTIVLVGHGGSDKLKIRQTPIRKPGKDEVLVNIKASGINFSEIMCRQGMYDRSPKLPTVLGLEAAGIIVEVGEDVKSLKVGDRVVCLKDFGLWTEFAAVAADNCMVMPEAMTFEEGAAIAVAYVTAHVVLFNFGNLRKGQSVLVHMAAGGVGMAATQLCKTVPDVTVFGTSSAVKHDRIKENGVTHAIDYRTVDYATEIRKLSPDGVDIVMDPLGGEDSTKSYNLLKPLGKIIHFGGANFVAGATKNYLQILKTWWSTKKVNPMDLMHQNKAVCGVHLGHMFDTPEPLREVLREVLDLYRQGHLKPVIDSVWAFEDVGKGMARMQERQNIGKVIISTEKEPEPKPEPEPKGKKKGEEKKEAAKAEAGEKVKEKEEAKEKASAEEEKGDKKKEEAEKKEEEKEKKEEEAQ